MQQQSTPNLGILAHQDEINKAYQRKSLEDFSCFYRGLVIDSQEGPRIFERCIAEFQIDFFEDIKSSLIQLTNGDKPDFQRWWLERTKKASKDADLAIIVIWITIATNKPFYGQIAAADKDQAAIIKERLEVLIHLNPWLNNYIEVVKYEIKSRKRMRGNAPLVKIDIMAADIAGSHGGTPDVLIINELSHITKWEFVENLRDNADGVARGMVIIATNAGFKGSKAEVWRNTALENPKTWKSHILARPAPWHNKQIIEEARLRNPRSRFKRLWEGLWASGKGDALSEQDIEACMTLTGPSLNPEQEYDYIAGMDLGISHDHAALVVLGINVRQQRIKLANWIAWKPIEDKDGNPEIDLIEVQNTAYKWARHYGILCIVYDPYEARLMSQILSQKSIRMREFSFQSQKNLDTMAARLIEAIENRQIDLYDDEESRIRRDLAKFELEEKAYGFRLRATSDETGHADVGTALAIALPHAVELLNDFSNLRKDDDLTIEEEDIELSQDEVDSMPKELRDIYEL